MAAKQISYRKQYINTYIWQALSVVTGFISLFVVIPYITTNKTIYGIYSVCTSLTIFFSYADLGFLTAAQKYGAEYFVRDDKENEIKVVGFVSWLMFVVFATLSTTFAVMAFQPKLLIPELAFNSPDYLTAQTLLFILSISSFVMLANRVLVVIYSIRVEDYKFQRIATIGGLIKIASVFFFFTEGRYMIIPYYLFFQTINLLVVLVGIHGIKNYGYSLTMFFRCFRFDKRQFNLTKGLSLAAFVSTITTIIFYELDSIVISHTLGVQKVAIYGVALTAMTIVRTYSSLIFSPYGSRFNHYIGNHDNIGLIFFVKKLITTFDSLFIPPIITLSILSLPFVVSWAGIEYADSAILITFLALSFAHNFIFIPVTSYFYAKERTDVLIKWKIVTPLIYWIGIIFFIDKIGLLSFAIFKFIAPLICTTVFVVVIMKDFRKVGISLISIKEMFFHIVIPLLGCGAICLIVRPFMYYSKNVNALLYNLLIMSSCILFTFSISMITNKSLRVTFLEYMKSIIKK